MIESGVVKVQTATWNALYGPAGMSPELTQKIYADVAKAFKQGAARERLLASGNEPVLNTPEQFKVFLGEEYKRWGDVIKRSEEQTSELQSLLRRSYADLCLHKQITPETTS